MHQKSSSYGNVEIQKSKILGTGNVTFKGKNSEAGQGRCDPSLWSEATKMTVERVSVQRNLKQGSEKLCQLYHVLFNTALK